MRARSQPPQSTDSSLAEMFQTSACGRTCRRRIATSWAAERPCNCRGSPWLCARGKGRVELRAASHVSIRVSIRARSMSQCMQQTTSSVRVCCMGRPLFLSSLHAALLSPKTRGGWFGIVALHEPCTDQQAAESLASTRASQMLCISARSQHHWARRP